MLTYVPVKNNNRKQKILKEIENGETTIEKVIDELLEENMDLYAKYLNAYQRCQELLYFKERVRNAF